jgi:predicted dithiol-disulfide oxidoreductase (DUF899 family)
LLTVDVFSAAGTSFQFMATDATKSEDQTMDKLDQPAHAARRRLPMVEVDNYTFTGPQGPVTLIEPFQDRYLLMVQNGV